MKCFLKSSSFSIYPPLSKTTCIPVPSNRSSVHLTQEHRHLWRITDLLSVEYKDFRRGYGNQVLRKIIHQRKFLRESGIESRTLEPFRQQPTMLSLSQEPKFLMCRIKINVQISYQETLKCYTVVLYSTGKTDYTVCEV